MGAWDGTDGDTPRHRTAATTAGPSTSTSPVTGSGAGRRIRPDTDTDTDTATGRRPLRTAASGS